MRLRRETVARSPGRETLGTAVWLPRHVLSSLEETPLGARHALLGLDELEGVHGRFSEEGFRIYDFSALTEMFRNTSVDEVDLSLIKAPHQALYAHFGAGAGLRSPVPGSVVEGVYVSFGYETVLSESGIECVFVLSMKGPRDIEEDFPAALAAMAAACPIEFALGESVPENIGRCSGNDWWDFAEAWSPFLHEPARVLFNALCYLDYEGREIDEEFPEGAPDGLVNQLSSRRPTEVRRAENRLAGLGFRRIYICGRETARRAHGGGGVSGGSRSGHWRSGHWRHQAYGPRHGLRKLIWIEPTMVGTGKPEDTVYVVRD